MCFSGPKLVILIQNVFFGVQTVFFGSEMNIGGSKCTIWAQNTSFPYHTHLRPYPPLAPPTTPNRASPSPCAPYSLHHLPPAQPAPTSCDPVPTTNTTHPHGILPSPPTPCTTCPPYRPPPLLPAPLPHSHFPRCRPDPHD